MTTQQKKTIERHLALGVENPNAEWREVYGAVRAKFRYEITETVLRMYFIERKQVHTICRTLKIVRGSLYYHVQKILNFCFLIAREMNLI